MQFSVGLTSIGGFNRKTTGKNAGFLKGFA
ncbi:hypothetical protein LSS_21745 [Leptospira santarosai serovar Shermani str. LT 821]|uniref:Uncharacterized protein n=1 Tax=Leptospira santarosai serovar Shermani str. LT 821 TaxID=758847 RepID=A0A097ESK2_9LEPT|nr:hypothetical protein LSS_21745 [Leptospira santarosai serovar Shermani str. LT 821]